MRHLNKRAQAVFGKRTAGLDQVGDHATIGNNDAFMAAHVEDIGRVTTPHVTGKVVSVAHYFKQNGDMMADPDMTFLVTADGRVFPMTFQQDSLGVYRQAAWVEDGNLKFRQREQADLTAFASQGIRNIKQQQFGRRHVAGTG